MKKTTIFLLGVIGISILGISCSNKKQIDNNTIITQYVENKNYIEDFKFPTLTEFKQLLNKYEFENEIDNPTSYGYEKDHFKDVKEDTNVYGYFHMKDLPEDVILVLYAGMKENIISNIFISDTSENSSKLLEQEYIVDIFNALFKDKSKLYLNKCKELSKQNDISLKIPLSTNIMVDGDTYEAYMCIVKIGNSFNLEFYNLPSELV